MPSSRSGYQEWESDPLFSAAEVVQDSADRMESVYRVLLHEQSLVQKTRHCDQRLLASVQHHRRQLATCLETVKWQLEDFEREVALAAATSDKSQRKQIAISRHKQFIGAIAEQISQVSKSLSDTLSLRNEWVDLDEQDRDGFAMFLSGEKSFQKLAHHNVEDRSVMTMFLDPSSSSSYNNEIVEQKPGDYVSLDMSAFEQSDNVMFRNVASQHNVQIGSDVSEHDEKENRVQEAKKFNGKSCSYRNKLGVFYSKINHLGSFRNLLSAYWTRGYRNFTKKWEDAEEQGHSSNDIFHATQVMQRRSILLRFAIAWRSVQRLWLELFAGVMYLFWRIRDWWRKYQRPRIT